MSAPAARAGGITASADAADRPVLFVTGHVPSYRVDALTRLHEREGLEVAQFGGSRRHGGPDPPGRCRSPCGGPARASCTRWRRVGTTGRSWSPPAVARRCWRAGPEPAPGAYR